MKVFITCITPILYSDIHSELKNILVDKYGNISITMKNVTWSPPLQYIEEMGDMLQTEIYIFELNFNEGDMVGFKHECMRLENNYAINNKRQFNLNPGFITNDGMYLLTHKGNDGRGRVLIGNSIWKEKQYDIVNGKLSTNQLTFSEYIDKDRLDIFNLIYQSLFILH